VGGALQRGGAGCECRRAHPPSTENPAPSPLPFKALLLLPFTVVTAEARDVEGERRERRLADSRQPEAGK
jgi:hypothetical protein